MFTVAVSEVSSHGRELLPWPMLAIWWHQQRAETIFRPLSSKPVGAVTHKPRPLGNQKTEYLSKVWGKAVGENNFELNVGDRVQLIHLVARYETSYHLQDVRATYWPHRLGVQRNQTEWTATFPEITRITTTRYGKFTLSIVKLPKRKRHWEMLSTGLGGGKER